ncbi:sugar phosphate isomerase/epimerase family protein [Chloroflexota bacterium]
MKLLARTQMLSQYSILDSLEVSKKLGFDGIEICVERKDWSLHDLSNIPVEAICERVDELNLAPHSFSLHQDYINDDDLFELTKAAIRMTPSLGTNIFVFSGAKKRNGDKNEWNRMLARTRILTSITEDCGVILAKEFEPEFVVGSTQELIGLFEEIPSPNLAANLDLGHVFICDPQPLNSINQLGGRIVHCHISGMPAKIHDHLLLSEGDMDLLANLHALAEIGFNGGVALDLYKYDYERVAEESVICFHDLLARL